MAERHSSVEPHSCGHAATICCARRSTVGELELPPEVRTHLGADDRVVCVVAVQNQQRHYVLVVDVAWLEFAAHAKASDPDVVADMALPRTAIRAVIETDADGRPAATAATASVWWSDDGIPHLSTS